MSAADPPRAAAVAKPAYHAGLDGLRAICLFAVLLFHSDFAGVSGGFLGVSTFFTLSGFLIASLLLAEERETGTVSLKAFWERRLRRLAPAALLGVAGVVATAPFWLAETQRPRLAADAIAAVLYLVNWRFVQAEYAYELIFVDPSPLQHFWSLAIEAQFYLFFPLVVGFVLRQTASVRVLAGVVTALIAVSIGVSFLPSVAGAGEHRIYYGSDARAAEILVGVLVAIAYDERWRSSTEQMPRWIRGVAPLALITIVCAWVFAQTSDVWLYRGGFAVYSIFSAFVVLGAMDTGVVGRLLSVGWLGWVGRVSYGAYVYHWPIFLILSEDRTGLGAVPLAACRIALTLCLAGLSSHLLEEPIRRRRWVRGSFYPMALAAGAATAVLAVAMADQAEKEDTVATAEVVETKPGVRRWMTFGDSTAAQIGGGIHYALLRRPSEGYLKTHAGIGCGVIEGGEAFGRRRWSAPMPHCEGFVGGWPGVAREQRANVVVVATGVWESLDWRFPPELLVLHLGDPAFDARVSKQVGAAMDGLVEAGAKVFWLTAPQIGRPESAKRRRKIPNVWLPGRQDRLNEIIRAEASRRSEVEVIDLAGFVREWPAGPFDPGLRPDGSHYSKRGARRVGKFVVTEIWARLDGESKGEKNAQEPS